MTLEIPHPYFSLECNDEAVKVSGDSKKKMLMFRLRYVSCRSDKTQYGNSCLVAMGERIDHRHATWELSQD